MIVLQKSGSTFGAIQTNSVMIDHFADHDLGEYAHAHG